jgi:hypothetical protein
MNQCNLLDCRGVLLTSHDLLIYKHLSFKSEPEQEKFVICKGSLRLNDSVRVEATSLCWILSN